MPADPRRVHIEVFGIVQGVGFRPFVFDRATAHGLSGYVENDTRGVEIEVEGQASAVDAFLDDLTRQKPKLAFLLDVQVRDIPPAYSQHMEIRPSRLHASRLALLPPDASLCDDCRRELFDPHDRRYRYPFVSCTNCGPRYTLIDDIPHDRATTAMARFPFCAACLAEYEDPRDRRFHAQESACPDCGPRVWLTDAKGARIEVGDPIRAAAFHLAQGEIVAVKGLGGFHLAVDASNSPAVARLRARKHRDEKPFAVMCRSTYEANVHGLVDDEAGAWLTSVHRPIVLVPRRATSTLAREVAPGHASLGLLLPYTPLHELLIVDVPGPLVMTSGNLSDEPIAIDNDEALARLAGIADVFLLHDRDILLRNDDSVMHVVANKARFIRRSRGFVPLPIRTGKALPTVLAVGGELKNTVCVTRGDLAFVSQHIGDLDHVPALDAFREAIPRFLRILDAKPEVLACDEHPDYASRRWADEQGLPVVPVQHHHAHVIACAAEHSVTEPVVGIALDGTGFGDDGAIWGGEILVADRLRFERAGHLGYVRLPGGDRAARQPFRMALAYLHAAYGDDLEAHLPESLRAIPEERRRAILSLVRSGAFSPWTSSAGRLFDGLASLLGLVHESSFEAQAAVRLMEIALPVTGVSPWPIALRREGSRVVLGPGAIVHFALTDLARGTPVPVVARMFHRTLAVVLAEAAAVVAAEHGLSTVALSGGCFNNALLLEDLSSDLERQGLRVLTHVTVPPGDGGLSLGQSVIAASRFLDRSARS